MLLRRRYNLDLRLPAHNPLNPLEMGGPPPNATIVPVTPFRQNCTVLWCARTRQAAFVDPGGELPRLELVLKEQGLTLAKEFLTHGHLDHAGTANAARRHFGVPIEGSHRDDQFLLDRLARTAALGAETLGL
jgi:glyoxylase-like metal-dependent hydrolase (beta-lactamase superfamily II)